MIQKNPDRLSIIKRGKHRRHKKISSFDSSSSSSSSCECDSSNQKTLCHDHKKCTGRDCQGNCSRNPCVDLKYTELKDPTEDLFHLYKTSDSSAIKVMDTRHNFCYDIRKVVPGTEADSSGIVYGYNKNQSIDLNGGVKKSYNRDFKKYKIQYNGAARNELSVYTPRVLKNNYSKIVSYYAQRGFQFQTSDSLRAYDGYYFPVNANPGRGLRFVMANDKCDKSTKKGFHCKKNAIPKAVDFYFADGTPVDYEPDVSKWINGAVYPIRIPITTDFCGEFNAKYDTEPIAYYDCETSTLTIHIPQVNNIGIYNRFNKNQVGSYNENVKNYILNFDGSYRLYKRDELNEIVRAEFCDFDYIVQVSEPAVVGRRSVNEAVSPPVETIVTEKLPMFGGVGVIITSPSSIAKTYNASQASFGPTYFDLTNDIVPCNPLTANGPIINGAQLAGKIALVQRGGNTFVAKTLAVQAAGAIGCIIFNNANASFTPGGSSSSVNIPCVGMSLADGTILLNAAQNSPPLQGRLASGALGLYAGYVFQKHGGDNPNYNVNVFPAVLNANVNLENPSDIDAVEPEAADNHSSRFKEGTLFLTGTNCFDTLDWYKAAVKFPVSLIKGYYYPEQRSTAPPPSTITNPEEITLTVLTHEYLHIANANAGGITNVPTEAMATAVENDYHVSNGISILFRPGSWCDMLNAYSRGLWTPMRNDDNPQTPIRSSTYGSSYFWTYLAEQFDTNYQLIRRVNDIMGSPERVELYNGYTVQGESNWTGGSFALDNALHDLYGRNIKDTFDDFAIASTMMRNNTSIPPKYRIQYPFWVYSSAYAGYPQVLAALTFLGRQQYSTWWDYLQNDTPLLPNMASSPAPSSSVGQSIIPTLPVSFSSTCVDQVYYAFSVPLTTNTVTVTILKGEWRISLFQFTSDNTPVGQFIMDGPHSIINSGSKVFNIASHVPAFSQTGKIRLVCTNVSMTDQGGINNFLQDGVISGSISIART